MLFSLPKVRIIAKDQGSPPRSATAIVYVTVLRNFFAPTWEPSSYSLRILETQAPGVEFSKVSARDRDQSVISFNLFSTECNFSGINYN